MKSALRNPWVIGGLGVLIVALLIYFVGPLLGFGEARPLAGRTARWVTIVAIVLIWVIVQLIRQLRASRAADQISSGIVEVEAEAGGDEDGRSAEEVAALKARFEEAVAVLKKTGGAQAKTLYDLPWYMIIGPPGAGKTTALVNSGLKFPLSERFGKNALRGVGGTRNCDWWFTDEAILLDTAGRYTTQDSQASVDRAAWEGFLELLRKYRKRRPINGVLVAISALDFMTMDANQRHQHASAIKTRIRELDEFFGMRFPVYVLVTKCDLVNGFVDFFDDLGQEERTQVWGVTLPLADDTRSDLDRDYLSQELDALLARLDERLFLRLHQERDLKRRSQIYSFPHQIRSLKAPLLEFLEEVFEGSRFEDSALLRGVYFTSGTQEGTPIDRVMGTISRTFGLEEQALPSFSGQGRSYFITRLLQQVVFAEAGIAGTNQKVERRRAWLQRISYSGVIVLVALLMVGWTVSYFSNRQVIAEVAEATELAGEKLAQIPQHRHEPEVTLDALDALREIALEREVADDARWAGMGLYQGERLAEQALSAYRRALVNQLLPRVMLRLEGQIDLARVPMDYTYEALKAYLRLGQEKRYDAEEIGAWVTLDWGSRLPRAIGTENYNAMTQHLASLLEQRPAQLPLPMDESVIARARQKLMRVPLEERIYARLKGSHITAEVAGFTILERAGPESLRVFVRNSGRPLSEGLPGFYTRDGYQTIFANTDSYRLVQELAAEGWVLRDEFELSDVQDLAAMLGSLQDLYFADYVQQYKDLLYDVELAPFRDAREAASILNVLSRPTDSPLTNLIEAVQRETNLSGDSGAEEESEDEGGDAFAAQRQRLQQVLGSRAALPGSTYQGVRYANIVEEEFRDFHELVGGSGGDPAPLQHLISLLRELADFMMLVASEESVNGIPQHVVQSGQATLQRVQFEAERMNMPVISSLLSAAATSVENIAMGGVATNVESQWKAGPLAFCQRAIKGRYPVARGERSEIRLEDFGRFFGYGGELDKFFESYLKDSIDTNRRPWRMHGRAAVQLSRQAILTFERAQAIKETFFRGDSQPYVGFDLAPISMDPSITQFSMTVNGQSLEYFHGPRVTQSLDWPGQGPGEVRIEMSPGIGTPMRVERGPWAWFRVLDNARMRAGSQPEHFEITFDLGGRTATYELVARSAYNPFKLDALSRFSCPQRLTQ